MADHENTREVDSEGNLTEEGEKELTRLWRIWRTVNEMLVDRVRFPSLLPTRSPS